MILTTVAIAGLVVAAVLVLVVLRSIPTRAGDRLLREHLLDRYVVTVLSGETFSGLLAAVDDRSVVLQDVSVLSANNSSVDGEVTLRRESIAYMQRP